MRYYYVEGNKSHIVLELPSAALSSKEEASLQWLVHIWPSLPQRWKSKHWQSLLGISSWLGWWLVAVCALTYSTRQKDIAKIHWPHVGRGRAIGCLSKMTTTMCPSVCSREEVQSFWNAPVISHGRIRPNWGTSLPLVQQNFSP